MITLSKYEHLSDPNNDKTILAHIEKTKKLSFFIFRFFSNF